MARNEEKAQQMLNKWVTMKQSFNAGNIAERRPFHAGEVTNLADAEKWRLQIMRETTKKVAEVQNEGLGEHKIRDLNDRINKLLREKGNWQKRIRELGGPDYNALEPKALDAEGRPLPGSGGYKYFGAARQLPGVKELFQRPEPVKRKRSRADIAKNCTPDYYGFRDDDDPELAATESVKEAELRAEALAEETEAAEQRRAKRKADAKVRNTVEEDQSSSDDDEAEETAFLVLVDRTAADTLDQFEAFKSARTLKQQQKIVMTTAPPQMEEESLASKKSSLLALLGGDAEFVQADEDDDDDEA